MAPETKVVRVIFWMVIALLAVGLLNIGLDLDASTFSVDKDGSTLTFTLSTEAKHVMGEVYGYTHRGIDHRLKSEGVSLFLGIILPLLLVVVSILFEPAVLSKLLALSGRGADRAKN
jgi:hypothetical protein